MPRFNWGAALGGLQEGFVEGQRINQARQELDLKRQMLKHQMELQKFELENKQRKAAAEAEGQRQLGADVQSYVGSLTQPTPAQPTVETERGDVDLGSLQQFAGQPGAPQPTRQMTPQEQYNVTAMRQGKFFAPSAGTQAGQRNYVAGPGTAVVDPTGKVLYQNPAQREGVGVEAQTWSRIVRENPGADLTTLRGVYNREIGNTATSRGAGTEQGKLNVQSTPAFHENVAKREESKAAGQPIPEGQANKILSNEKVSNSLKTLRANFDKSFLGPIQGTDIAFEARRRVGTMMGHPLSQRETIFRQELANLKNTALYDASGAQINEQEQKRISGVLPKATDESDVFEAGVQRYEAEVAKLGLQRREMINTPRSGAIPPPPAGWRPR